MMARYRTAAFAWTLVAAFAGAQCAKAPPPKPPDVPVTIAAPPEAKVKASMTIAASADTNPDANGRPSPIVVRVYQLKGDAAFTGAEFFPLFDEEQKVLGAEFITRDEFVGAVAAFRDIQNAQWRAVVPAPRSSMTVDVQRLRIVLSVVE
jgi:type VI secretion system protein VasD